MEERYGVNGYIAKFCGELLALFGWFVVVGGSGVQFFIWMVGIENLFFVGLDRKSCKFFFMEGFLVKFSLWRVGGERSIVCIFFYYVDLVFRLMG